MSQFYIFSKGQNHEFENILILNSLHNFSYLDQDFFLVASNTILNRIFYVLDEPFSSICSRSLTCSEQKIDPFRAFIFLTNYFVEHILVQNNVYFLSRGVSIAL